MNVRSTNSDASIRYHWTMLVVSCGVVILAFLLQVRSDQRIAVWGLARYPLPHTCMARSLFGVDCPGCGLTRSLVHLARLDLQASLEAHRLGWLMAVAVVLQFPYRILRLLRPGGLSLGNRIPKWFGQTLIFARVPRMLHRPRKFKLVVRQH